MKRASAVITPHTAWCVQTWYYTQLHTDTHTSHVRFILTLRGIHLYSYSAWCFVYCLHIYIKVRGSIQTRCLKPTLIRTAVRCFLLLVTSQEGDWPAPPYRNSLNPSAFLDAVQQLQASAVWTKPWPLCASFLITKRRRIFRRAMFRLFGTSLARSLHF